MELSSQQGEIPIPIPLPIQISIPINSSYGGGHAQGHMIHHEPAPPNHIILPTSAPQNHIIPTSAPQISSNGPIPTNPEDPMPYKKMVRYKECLKNHAAAMGGNATDGCGEYMPSGLEGTLEALICSACNCHRNFHRKEVEGENNCDFFAPQINHMVNGRKLILGHHHKGILGTESLGYPRTGHHHQIMMSYNVGSINSESDEQDGGGCGGGVGGGVVVGRALQPPLPQAQMVKKRFRTKFSQEQKGKMLEFAEKVGWKIQKQEENVVQQFCQEIGVKRRVLKVWMHNNKHNLAKKNSSSSPQNPI